MRIMRRIVGVVGTAVVLATTGCGGQTTKTASVNSSSAAALTQRAAGSSTLANAPPTTTAAEPSSTAVSPSKAKAKYVPQLMLDRLEAASKTDPQYNRRLAAAWKKCGQNGQRLTAYYACVTPSDRAYVGQMARRLESIAGRMMKLVTPSRCRDRLQAYSAALRRYGSAADRIWQDAKRNDVKAWTEDGAAFTKAANSPATRASIDKACVDPAPA